jgi:hypothetical protein
MEAAMTANTQTLPEFGRELPGWRTYAVLAAWLLAIVWALNAGLIFVEPVRPPLGLLLVSVGPPVLAVIVYLTSAAARAYVHALDLRFLTAFQAWRVVGGAFVVLNAQNLLPGLFAYPAGYGDLLVGVLALFVLMALIDRTPGWRTQLVRLNVLGLIDFVAAFVAGLLASPGPLGLLQGDIPMAALAQYPLNLIPTYGVPVFALAHLAALAQLRRQARVERQGERQAGSAVAVQG